MQDQSNVESVGEKLEILERLDQILIDGKEMAKPAASASKQVDELAAALSQLQEEMNEEMNQQCAQFKEQPARQDEQIESLQQWVWSKGMAKPAARCLLSSPSPALLLKSYVSMASRQALMGSTSLFINTITSPGVQVLDAEGTFVDGLVAPLPFLFRCWDSICSAWHVP